MSDSNSDDTTFTPPRLTRSPEMMNISDTFSDESDNNEDTYTATTAASNPVVFALLAEDEQRLDEKFAELKPRYMDAIQNAVLYNPTFESKLRELLETEMIIDNTIRTYLAKKTFINTRVINWEALDSFRKPLVYLIREYLYFGVCPSLANLVSNGVAVDDDVVSIGDNTFQYRYFIWRREGDDKIGHPPSGIGITEINYEEYRKNRTQGWSRKQLTAFVTTNVIPELLNMTNLRIAFTNKYYNKRVHFGMHSLNLVTTLYIRFHDQFFNSTVAEIFTSLEQKRIRYNQALMRLNQYYDTLRLADFETSLLRNAGRKMLDTYSSLLELKRQRMRFLNRKLRQHAITVQQQNRKPETVRFRWQKLCKPTSLQRAFSLDELRDLAAFEGIPEYLFQTKAEICGELAQRFERVIQGKAKVIPKCINTSSLMLTDLADIPPEFFYSYIHNNKIYCDDIRDLYRHFKTQGAKHPIDRTTVSDRLIRNVVYWYQKLNDTTTTMDDLFTEPEPVLSASSMLTSKATEFVSQLNYPNSVTFFIDADLREMKAFVDELVTENIIFPAERARLNAIDDATQYKLLLIDVLLLKFRNDPAQIRLANGQTLSSLAINASNVYNNHFYRE